MNRIMSETFPELKMYQSLRDAALAGVTDEDLAFRISPKNATLGELFREMGEWEHAYTQSFKALTFDYAYHTPDAAVAKSVTALQTWFAELDAAMEAALDANTDADLDEKIITRSSGSQLKIPVQLGLYKEAMLIFYGKLTPSLRELGKEPEHWQEWIG